MKYYEDIELGKEFIVGTYQISKEDIIEFARKWDPQPFHIDETAAAESLFGGLTASSCHTYAITAKISHGSKDQSAIVAMLSVELRAPKPVYAGDTLTMTKIDAEKRLSNSRPTVGIVKSVGSLRNQQGELVFEIISNYMIQTRNYSTM